MLIVYQKARLKRHRIRATTVRLFGATKATVYFESVANPDPQFCLPGRWSRMYFSTTPSRFPYSTILAAIANQDFPARMPVLHGHVFMLNERSGLTFHMYDDRGADVIGPNISSLRALYEGFTEFILDYDRPAIDARFA